MPQTNEWKDRIDRWMAELRRQFYLPLAPIHWSGFTTYDALDVASARQGEFQPMPEGTEWGREWEYGWFRGEIVLPEEARDKRIVIDIDLGGEATLFLGNQAFGTKRADWITEKHHFLCDQTLAEKGSPGHTYGLLVECYAGHRYFGQDSLRLGPGPVPLGRFTPPDLQELKKTVGASSFGIWNETAYQLYLDARTLFEVSDGIDPDSLRASEIEQALRDFTVIVDFEQSEEEMNRTLEEARQRLEPLLGCVNGSTAPEMFMFGHAHIDVAWLWPIAETDRKCARTFAAQLRHLDRYPDYLFLQSQPYLYMKTKMNYPELFERIREKVAQGRFIPEGGMWVEADTNLTGGESLIRQFLHGKRFFQEEFGIESKLLWLPDVFGYSAALPQIMRGCGIQYFSTAKIFWDYNGGDRFPFHHFLWQGLDGSEVTSFIHVDYDSDTRPGVVIDRWRQRVQKSGLKTFLFPFGYGDGGGGPTRDHIEYALRERDLEGVPKVRMTGPVQFFQDLAEQGGPVSRYVGELYFQAHRGVFTSQARTKRANRKCEIALREAEIWGGAANVLKGHAYPSKSMDAAWKTVLLNQFHDILPGSSIARVYEEAEAAYGRVLCVARDVAESGARALTENHPTLGIAVFNSLSWRRRVLVELPEGCVAACGADGQALPVQWAGDRTLAEVEVPSCGWTSLLPGKEVPAISNSVCASTRGLENQHLRVAFDEFGEIVSLFDKDAARELATGNCNQFRMFKDVPRCFDAWDIDRTYERMPVELPETARFERVTSGPLVASLRITRKLNDYTMTQTVSLKSDVRRVDFETNVDWQETHKLLKVAFPVDFHAEEGVHEIQFGHIRRPNHRSRKYDEDRFEVCNHKWSALMEENRGFAVLNDCKYGVSVLGNCISLTLLRAPTTPDFTADRGIQKFTYSFYTWNGTFMDSDVVREAYDLNIPAMTVQGSAGSRSLFEVSEPNVIIEAVKPAEDGSLDIIVRLYECKHAAVKCTLTTVLPFVDAWESDMLERSTGKLEHRSGLCHLDFRPFEIKTLRFVSDHTDETKFRG